MAGGSLIGRVVGSGERWAADAALGVGEEVGEFRGEGVGGFGAQFIDGLRFVEAGAIDEIEGLLDLGAPGGVEAIAAEADEV